MPALKNPKHEAFAQALAKGIRGTEAYVSAGYKASPAAATRLSKQVKVVERVKELTAVAVKEAQRELKYDALSIFKRIDDIIEAAITAKDLKVAMQGATFIAKAFGYEDHPTLTHEHVNQAKVNIGQPAPNGGDADETPDATPEPANINRFGDVMKKLKKANQK